MDPPKITEELHFKLEDEITPATTSEDKYGLSLEDLSKFNKGSRPSSPKHFSGGSFNLSRSSSIGGETESESSSVANSPLMSRTHTKMVSLPIF